MTMLVINTTNGADVPAGFVQLNDNLRETEKMIKEGKSVAPDQRYRNLMIPEFALTGVVEQFQPILLDKLYSVAKRKFEVLMTDSNRMARETDSSEWTVAAVMQFYATDAVSGRMTKEQIVEWYKAGDTYALTLEKKGEKFAQGWLEQFSKMASSNHGVNPNTCRVLLAGMQPKDAASEIGKAIASKFAATIAKSEVSQVEGL